MKQLDQITNIYFLGIGGIGMSALARYFHQRGVNVSGYDKTPSPVTAALEKEGVEVTYADDPSTIRIMPELVIRTPAVPLTTTLYGYFLHKQIPIRKRAEILGIISAGIPTIGIAGTHGKTTIAAMLTHIFKTASVPCISFLGGIATNYNTNFLGEANPQWMIAEADEFDRSFLHLSPKIALISAIDSDHMDIYKNEEALLESFSLFAKKLPPDGTLITGKDVSRKIRYENPSLEYHRDYPADYYLENVYADSGHYHADMAGLITIRDMQIGHPGKHNLENALAATALAHQAGIAPQIIKKALNSFLGVKRRFEICLHTAKMVYIDDYAHLPEEINACISSAREMWPEKKITVVFQPHLYSRTRDLAVQFAESLSEADQLILMDIYPAREKPIPGVDVNLILKKIKGSKALHCSREKLPDVLKALEIEILITMGAGDIDRFAEPIKKILTNRAMS
ncbi:MAG: UDP-N-acetylmuramate--L-alanine ligase [Bacteroidia bacterium]|nr:MAG: UDP-N-acetylmuramate--L-alanine ligase [Bacteroidia bacterium]